MAVVEELCMQILAVQKLLAIPVATNREFAEIHSYYTSRKDNPLKKKQSLIALCCKLIRVFFALATKDDDYDPVRLLGDIHHPVAVAA